MAWTSDSLLKLFAGLLATGAGGCAAEPSIDLRQFDMDLCGEEGLRPLGAVAPEEAVDYLELRLVSESEFGDQTGDRFDEPVIRDADGEKCGGASDREACLAEFDGLPYDSEIVEYNGFEGISTHRSLPYTRGDVVGVLSSTAAVKEFLGDIDAPGDAVLWASLQAHNIVCGEGNDVGSRANGFVLHTTSGSSCGSGVKQHVILVRPDGQISTLQTVVTSEGDPNCSVGRIPDGFCRAPRSRGRSPVGRFLARVAELEAASVDAFAQFGAELHAHGAPAAFVAGAESARQDEVRHAAATRRLARRYGSSVSTTRVPPVPLKNLVALAADNAAEGCVRETFGALVAHAQARNAQDPEVRRVMQTIARDETRHAALSWRVAGWARTRMGSAERARVTRSARRSVEQLREDLTAPLHPRVHTVLGMPEPAEAGALFAGLHAGLLRQLEA